MATSGTRCATQIGRLAVSPGVAAAAIVAPVPARRTDRAAAVYERPGDAHEVLELRELPTPEPGPGEVRVRLRLAGVNPTDWKSRAARPPAAGFQVPGQDGAGEIDMVGEGLPRSLHRNPRLGLVRGPRAPWGTRRAVDRRARRARRPAARSACLELGASLGVPAITAHHCLFADGPLAAPTCSSPAARGAVGHFAIELARWGGARGPQHRQRLRRRPALARAAGAEVVVDYR